MSAIDWPAMLAQLEQQRTALDEERQDIDAVIETVRRRAGAVVPAGLTLPPTRSAKPARNGGPTRKRQDKISASQIARIRRGWEAGEPATAIAKAAKVSDVTVRNRAKAGDWKRPKIAAAPTPKGTKLAGSVRCTSCDVHTEYDPCQHCGHKLKRKGW